MAIIEQLEATCSKRIAELQARIEALEAENARLRKDSSNSHKPPSSDIVKPKPPRRSDGKRRSIGQIARLVRKASCALDPAYAELHQALERERTRFLHAARHPPWTAPARNMAERFRRHADAYFRFITTPGVEPTNNLAEQALRFVVIDRRMTQRTRGESGRAWCERIWTALATCRQQRRSLYEFLSRTLEAHFGGHPTPSLLAG